MNPTVNAGSGVTAENFDLEGQPTVKLEAWAQSSGLAVCIGLPSPAQLTHLGFNDLPLAAMSAIMALSAFLLGRYPVTGGTRLINCFKNLLIPCAELEIRKTVLIPSDGLYQVVYFKYLHIEVAQPSSGEVKAKEG